MAERRRLREIDEPRQRKQIRSRSPPIRMTCHFRSSTIREDSGNIGWPYPRAYSRSPSPSAGGRAYRIGSSPCSPSTRKGYYQGDESERLLPRMRRDRYYREHVDTTDCHKSEPESCFNRTRGCGYSYGNGTDSFREKERYFKLPSPKERSRYDVDSMKNKKQDGGLSILNHAPTEPRSCQRHIGQLAERSGKYATSTVVNNGSWDEPPLPPSSRRYKDNRVLYSVSEQIPCARSVSDVGMISTPDGGPSLVIENFPARIPRKFNSGTYDSIPERRGNDLDDLGYLEHRKANVAPRSGYRHNKDYVSAEVCPFDDGSTRLRGHLKREQFYEKEPMVFDHLEFEVHCKNSEMPSPVNGIMEELSMKNWKSRGYMVDNGGSALRNVDREWNDSPATHMEDSFDRRHMLVSRNSDTFEMRNYDDGDIFDDDMGCNYETVENEEVDPLLSSSDPAGESSYRFPLESHDFTAESQTLSRIPNNIKKRLGGSASDIKMRLGPVRNVKQRLGPVPNVGRLPKHSTKGYRKPPSLENHEREFRVNIVRGRGSRFDHTDARNVIRKIKKTDARELLQNLKTADDRDMIPGLKTDPPEDSADFKQQVQNAFFKYVKLLNENAANRRRYMEQGDSGSFTCSVCGSSKEFVSVLGVAQHAFMSCKVGLKCEHKGFHKALCVLMGWKAAESPTDVWTCTAMSASEAASVKDDLIIWPPLVIIHNSSITNGNPHDSLVVSTDQLREFLNGVGIGELMVKLCRGKAANQSILVASFKGTYSGLEEALKLHRIFAYGQHGRSEFEELISSSRRESKSEASSSTAEMKVNSILYGYLGTADDLCRLGFEMKKKCLVKSKNEIDCIAGGRLG